MSELRQDSYIMGDDENRSKINIVYQQDLPKKAQPSDILNDIPNPVLEKSKLEEAFSFFSETINRVFGTGEYTSNEVVEYLQTTEESQSKYETTEGGMFLFKYEPTTKKKLKYYDSLPLIINMGKTSDSLVGLNLHYLPIRQRLALMKSLFGDGNMEDIQEDDIQNSLGKISSYRFIKPTYKQYKYIGITSRLVRIPVQNWVMASLLPISKFEKRSRREVWEDSIKKINKEDNF